MKSTQEMVETTHNTEVRESIKFSAAYEAPLNGCLFIRYDSRRGLCAILCGPILDVGTPFGQEFQVQEITCTHKGNPQCTMEVTFR